MTIARRTALSSTAALAISGALAACSSGDSGDKAIDPAAQSNPADEASAAPADAPAPPEGNPELTTTDEVAVGACAVFPDAKLVVTQPSEGTFKCFTSVCPHAGCEVSSGSDGFIPCVCHGSEFSLLDGSVLRGPATTGLAEVAISVKDGKIVRA